MPGGWQTWLIVALTTITTLLMRITYRMHLSAVQSQRERADDNRARAEAAELRADVSEDQKLIILGGVLAAVGSDEDAAMVAQATATRLRRRSSARQARGVAAQGDPTDADHRSTDEGAGRSSVAP